MKPLTSPQSTEPKGVGPGIVAKLRRGCKKPDGTKRRPSPRELEAADTIERLVEALEEAQLQLQYLDERFPTGTTPAVLARIVAAFALASGDALSNDGGGSHE